MSCSASRCLHRERDELLLGAVVDVALELATLLVLGGDQPLLGRLQLGEPRLERRGETLVAQHEAGLRREIADEPLLGRVDRIVRWHRDRERSEQLSLVAHLDAVRSSSDAPACRGQCWPDATSLELDADLQPDARPFGSDALAEHSRRSGEHVVGRVRARELVAELGHHLVRRGALPVDETVGEAPRARVRAGWKTIATTAAASAESTGLCPRPDEPRRRPTTRPTYTERDDARP